MLLLRILEKYIETSKNYDPRIRDKSSLGYSIFYSQHLLCLRSSKMFRSPVPLFSCSPLFSRSPVLPFSRFPVLPFSRSPVLPFSRSSVLPFSVPRSPSLVLRSLFSFPRSPFLFFRSSFSIPPSPFPVLRSSYSVSHSPFLVLRFSLSVPCSKYTVPCSPAPRTSLPVLRSWSE